MYAIVDIETAGFGRNGNKITEIAIMVHDGNKVISEFHSLVNPGVKIPASITGLTGITNKDLKDAPVFEEIAQEVISITKGMIFVAHSVNFDYNIIRNELAHLGLDYKRKKLCTVRLSKKVFPGLESYSLGNVCGYLDIPVPGRHRAGGDAKATVQLFEKILATDKNGTIQSFLNQRSREGTLPPLLPKEVIDGLPEVAGVYYFHDENGKVIYVGKAINIKDRVLSHFHASAEKEVIMSQSTANVTFETTGNELVALLLESAEIKRIFPKYNSAQRRATRSYGITSYEDRAGILHLGFNRSKLISSPIATFYSVQEARAYLNQAIFEYDLCPKYCQVQQSVGACHNHSEGNCNGVCCGEEKPNAYNKRVRKAIRSLSKTGDDFLIIEKGRKRSEKSVIMIEDGRYRGFGYFPTSKKPAEFSEFAQYIEPRKDNIDVQGIIRQYLNSTSGRNIVYRD